MWRDHPRSRGVYCACGPHCERACGSSPLARGLHLVECKLAISKGIIPARAGFTRPVPSPTRRTPDHPRSRGVYDGIPATKRHTSGSSPLARGLPRPRLHAGDRRRIIPARAGFTRRRMFGRAISRDHPRSRGVYRPDLATIGARLGSSPLARGLLWHVHGRGCQSGIIPARAGFTSNTCAGRTPSWDHPRSRGVYPHERRNPMDH